MISNEVRKYCRKIFHHLIENYDEALKSDEMYICHHRREIAEDGTVAYSQDELIDLGLYYHRPPEELIFLTQSKHKALHEAAKNRGRTTSLEHKRALARERSRKWRNKNREAMNQKFRDKYKNDPEYRKYKQLSHSKWRENKKAQENS